MKRLKQIDKALRKEAESLLNAHQIWAFDAHGWVSAEDIDPEFVGHAMWQLDPPIDIDQLIFGERFPTKEPASNSKEWRQSLAVIGTDFEGLMKAARMSIGLYLVQSKLTDESQFPSDDFLDLHWTSSIIYLATASERLKQFFIAAAFRQTNKQYLARDKRQKRRKYTTPFLEAQQQFTTAPLSEPVGKLVGMADQIWKSCGKRHALVHELATAIGRRKRELIDRPAQPADDSDFDFSKIKQAVQIAKLKREQQQATAIAELRDWYDLLNRAITEAFIFENRRRHDATEYPR